MAGRRRRPRDLQSALPPMPSSQAPTPGQPTAPAPPHGAHGRSRRELRAERQRQKRRRLGVAGLAGIVVVALAIAAAVGFGVHKATSGGTKKPQGQTTLLLSITGAGNDAVETSLLAHDDTTHRGLELLMPSRLLTEVCGFGNQQLGQVLALPNGQSLARSTVSTLLGGVTVDGSWVLTTAQLSKLVDAVGGVTVDVDTNVVANRTVIITKGPGQHLNGARALEFATYRGGGETALDNLPRFQAVIDGIEAALPTSSAAVAQLIGGLGPTAASSLGTSRLADLLVGMAADAKANNVLASTMPVVAIDAGSGDAAYRVDTAQTSTFVNANLLASLPASARVPRKRVLIQNGVGTPGLTVTACDRLVKAGFAFAGSGNADNFNYKVSQVLVPDASVASARLGDSVATALGLSSNDVVTSPVSQNIADVIVILGRDYKS